MEASNNYGVLNPTSGLTLIGGLSRRFSQLVQDHFIPHENNQYHPRALRHQTLALWSLLLVAIKISTVAVLAFGSPSPVYSSAITSDTVIALTNESRAQFNLSKLVYNSELAQAAQAKANDMLAKQYFAHNTPDGKRPWDFIRATGYSYVVAGENLAIHFQQAEDIEEAWMNSPGHRANILNKDFQEIGIGISQGVFEGYDTTIVVQMFGTPIQHPYVALDTPTPVAGVATAPTLGKPAPAPIPAKPAVAVRGVKGEAKAAETVPAVIISSTNFVVDKGSIAVTVGTEGPVSRVLVRYGSKSVMLDPSGDHIWKGSVQLSELAQSDTPLIIDAMDMQGQLAREYTASFARSLYETYGASPIAPQQSQVTKVAGFQFDPNALARNIFSVFIVLALMALFVVIAVRRHVQHINLIAHLSLVVVLATVLWVW